MLVWQITGDGEATPFEGAALIATFVILATVAWFRALADPARTTGVRIRLNVAANLTFT